ncbi:MULTISPECIES: hypothetical protein [Bacillus]|uniref:hypothetical protein n=1 Tax=Bacillus TaxID=1386 RepID=UPI0011552800|nr:MULTISPECIES: hypothetical protein [Bacillus cereus group]MDF9469015.1 hypothetical protein [Bacillus cereus]MED3269340.1 hypothetical protein [Bacillus thuringiensis]
MEIFESFFTQKYYLFLAELLALNNSDNREDLQKVLKTLDMTGFIGLFGVRGIPLTLIQK